MNELQIGLAIVVVTLVVLFSGLPIAWGLALVAVGFLAVFEGVDSLVNVPLLMMDELASFALLTIPLFILLGAAVSVAAAGRDLYESLHRWLDRVPGGLVIVNILACGVFAAICGSSPATAAAIGKAGVPEMIRRGVRPALAAASMAAGGTLGILIPPSVVLIVYAILAEQNIAKLFAAAMVPGIIGAALYIAAIAVYVRLYPSHGPAQPRHGARELLQAAKEVWPIAIIFVVVFGGIYGGFFTPTEGAAVGAVSTGLLAWGRGGLTRKRLQEAFESTAGGTAMVFMIVLGAAAYNSFLALSQLPQELAGGGGAQGFSPYMVLWAILVFYLSFGCVMDSLSMILLTIPIFFPMVSGLDFGLTPEETAIWFGILVLIVVEVGLITPPVGMNLFVIQSMAPYISIRETYRGVWPFVASDLLRVLLLVLVPGITLFVLRL